MKHNVEGYEQNGYPLRDSIIPMDQYMKHFTCIETIQTNQKELPKEIKEIKGKEKNSWIACNEGGANFNLSSCFVKTKST